MAENANTRIYDKTIDRAAMIRLYERRINEKVGESIDGHVVRLDSLLKASKGSKDLFEEVDRELVKTYKEIYNTTSRSLLDLFVDQASFAYQNIEVAVGKIWATERPKTRLAEDVVLKRPLYDDKTLLAGWSTVGNLEKKRLEALIRKGIADNRSIDEIALDIRKGNIHNITRSQARALVITSVTSVTSQADMGVYKANAGALKGWQYVAVLDAKTTPVCRHRDGHVYPLENTAALPPAHFRCRSTTVPVTRSWEELGKSESLSRVRKKNLDGLSEKEKAFYDGMTPMKESYQMWLERQPNEVKLRHLGDSGKVQLFNSGQLEVDRFVNPEGNSIGIKELRAMSDSGYTLPNDTVKFARAKEALDRIRIGATTPEDFYGDKQLVTNLKNYYLLQSGELDGTLSLTNYRGLLMQSKKAVKGRVLSSPPREDQLKFNPITGRYEDVRLYQPNPAVFNNNMRLLKESEELKDIDKEFIQKVVEDLDQKMSLNERAVVLDNLRIMFTRYRKNQEPWGNFKAVVQSQIKFDVMNVSDSIETQIRKDSDFLKKLTLESYIDPVLGAVQLDDLHDNFIANIYAKNKWEDTVAPKIANRLRSVFDKDIAKATPLVWSRLSDHQLQQFYLKFAHRLSLSDTPDRDQLAVALGRDLYNLANYNGNRKQWYELGLKLLENEKASKLFKVETFGVQKRRLKSKMSGAYFGPYYDTLAYNIRIVDPQVQEYSKLTRSVELGLRVSVLNEDNRLVFRKGFKTYFVDRGILGYEDTRIPVTSTGSFSDFPEEFMDDSIVDALNWASQTRYRVDKDYYDFTKKLLYFEDDKGLAKHYNERNEYRKFIAARGDAYERFKTMEWLRARDSAFSNHAFIDHRARVYDRGLISPQSGETFRPFLNTEIERTFSKADYLNLQDQIGAFLGGLSDKLEGRHNSLTITGRQKIAEQWRPELIKIGNHMLRGKPGDIRAILDSDFVASVEGEELGKFFRFAIEQAKIDSYLGGSYKDLDRLSSYKTALALEQDASSSGAQIIALTTRNKQLAELSNVVPTNQKRRLYDEIAASTYNDPRFREINKKLGLTEKDLRKAAKAQNMVTFYGAGERTGIMNVEGKLGKVLGKEQGTLVVKAADRDTVLDEISAQAARYDRFDPETAAELRQLRQDVKDVFNKGIDPGDDIMDQLYFLQPQTRELVEKMTRSYDRVVTPDDFKAIAKIMSEHLAEQVPILKDFTRFFGRLAEDYLTHAKPSSADFDWQKIAATEVRGTKIKGYTLSPFVSRMLGVKANEPLSEKFLKRFGFWEPNGNLAEMLYGVEAPKYRRTGGKFFKTEVVTPADLTLDNLSKGVLLQERSITGVELFTANKLPKSWTNVPWVNFDGKVIEQNFTQAFEERLIYRDADGNVVTNILQIPQKTSTTWWEELANKSGKINDIADVTKARTAFAVNGGN